MSKRINYRKKSGFILIETLIWLLLLEVLFGLGLTVYPSFWQRLGKMQQSLACLGVSDLVLTAQQRAMLECSSSYSVNFTGGNVEMADVEQPVRQFNFSWCGLGDFKAEGPTIRFTRTGNVRQSTRFSVESTAQNLPIRTYYLEPVRGRLVYED
jgi:type II secretory pathway pseudopilin PulG